MKRLLLSLFLMFAILLTSLVSCEKNISNETVLNKTKIPEQSSLEVQADAELFYENMYRIQPFTPYSDNYPKMYSAFLDNGSAYVVGSTRDFPGSRLYEYDNNGRCIANYPAQFTDTAVFYDGFVYTADLWGPEMVVSKLDLSGEVIVQTDAYPVGQLNEYGGFSLEKDVRVYLKVLSNDYVIACLKYDMYIFNGDLTEKPIYVDLPGTIDGFEQISDDMILIFTASMMNDEWGTNYHTVNLKTGEVEKYSYDLSHSQPHFDNVRKIIRSGNALYAVCNDGLYVQHGDTPELIASWDESYIDYRYITLLDVIDEEHFLVSYWNNLLGGDTEYGYLTKVTEKRTKPREVITMASIGLVGAYREFVRAAVREFNRENQDYLIYYYDYDNLDKPTWTSNYSGTAAEKEQAQKNFEFDIIEGKIYDCYIFPDNSPNRKMLADKNALCDLSEFLYEGQLLGCVERAFVTGGKCVAVPFFVMLSSLVTTQNVLLSNDPFTYDKLYEMADKLKPGESLFCNDVTENLIRAGQYAFIDFDAKDCSFDSEAYYKYLAFMKEVSAGKHTDEEKQPMLTYEYGYDKKLDTNRFQKFAIASDEGLDNVRTGAFKFSQWDFYSQASLEALMIAYHQQMINYCGYPYEGGTGVLLKADALFSITTTAKNPAGAAAFMSYIFSEKIQTCYAVKDFGLPASRAGMEAVFPLGYLHLYYLESTPAFDDWMKEHPTSMEYDSRLYETPLDFNAMKQTYCIRYINITKDDRDLFIRFLDRARPITVQDTVINDIVEEEMSYYFGGVRGVEDTAHIIQSRVRLYLNE